MIVKTPKEGCLKYATLVEVDAWPGSCSRCPGVQTHGGAAERGAPDHRRLFEGNPKWLTIAATRTC